MGILREVCSLPTAPFLEHQVVRYVERFVSRRCRLRLVRDSAGNLLIELPGRDRRLPRWVFGAHMDHPGFVAVRMLDRRTLQAEFRGSVLAELMSGTPVVFFGSGGEVRGRVLSAKPGDDAPWAKVVRIRVAGPVEAGTPGMFDQGEGRVKGRLFYSRAIDDLGGAAAALAMLDRLGSDPPRSTVAVLLTRAEEEGFIGAIAACLRPTLLRKSDRMVAIECSAMQPYAPQGAGPIIRVGDRTSTFNSALTCFLAQRAEAIRKKRRSFQYQRALMPGGTCEATVYDIYGYRASCVCVALGNYHNMDRTRKRIGPEFINVQDWKGMVELFVSVARHGHEFREGHKELRGRIETRFKKLRRLLRPRQEEFAGG